MMMLRHAPPSPSARVAYHFPPVFPAGPWMILACLVLRHHHPHHPTLVDGATHLTPPPSTGDCDWLDNAAPMMHSWTSFNPVSGFFYSILFIFCLFVFQCPVLWNNCAWHVLCWCLLGPGGLSDSIMCLNSRLFVWDHCGSGKPLCMTAFIKCLKSRV